jgi:hypothetical protein
VTHNELKKGDRVRATGLFGLGPRYAVVVDNRKGIGRMLHIEESNGHFPDMGDTYVDEITHVEVDGAWEPVELSPAHAKKMKTIREMGF